MGLRNWVRVAGRRCTFVSKKKVTAEIMKGKFKVGDRVWVNTRKGKLNAAIVDKVTSNQRAEVKWLGRSGKPTGFFFRSQG